MRVLGGDDETIVSPPHSPHRISTVVPGVTLVSVMPYCARRFVVLISTKNGLLFALMELMLTVSARIEPGSIRHIAMEKRTPASDVTVVLTLRAGSFARFILFPSLIQRFN